MYGIFNVNNSIVSRVLWENMKWWILLQSNRVITRVYTNSAKKKKKN